MESSSPNIVRAFAEFLSNTLFKLACRLVCEGNRENFPRSYNVNAENAVRHAVCFSIKKIFARFNGCIANIRHKCAVIRIAVFDHIGYSVDENRCFSAARACKHQKRPLYRCYSLKLHIVHIAEIFFYDRSAKFNKIHTQILNLQNKIRRRMTPYLLFL